MRVLDIGYKKSIGGLKRNLVRREGDIVLCEIWNTEGNVCGYDVHIVQRAKNDYRNIQKGDEYLVSEHRFGKFAWSYQELKNAESKFNNLVSEAKSKV